MQVSRQTINAIETERYTPSLPLALALARYFETTVEEMFDDDACIRRSGSCPCSRSPSGVVFLGALWAGGDPVREGSRRSR